MSYDWLFVGLGNPGTEYEKTRHNAGFMLLDSLCDAVEFQKKHNAFVSSIRLNDQRVLLCKPLSYMNLSGSVTSNVSKFYDIPLHHIIVFHDELELPFGTARWKLGGGHGGHNGLRHISEQCGKEYGRFRIGIGRPTHQNSVSNFVLSAFKLNELDTLKTCVFPSICHAISLVMKEEYDAATKALQAAAVHPLVQALQ